MSDAGRLRLRQARLEDIPEIHAIESTSFGDPWTPDSFAQMFEQPRVLATVALSGDALVGYCIAWQIADEAEIANIAVRADLRGQGVGGALLDDLIVQVGRAGGATIYLEVREGNTPAQALYRSRGFAAAGRRAAYYQHPEEDALVFRREWAGPPGDD
ncbi:MAG: ribosomal protein S18-alanine N-acetyltransferase [Gemmatimonadaceae bacterium]